MTEALTKANINIFAILRNFEDLCEMDKEAKELIKDKNVSIEFCVKNGPEAVLNIISGRCILKRGKGDCDIKLYFKSPEQLNSMFEGKSNPIILKGFTKISILKNEFIKLTEKLTYYLKPTEELLKDPSYFKINTFLSLYTAFYSLVEIGNNDKVGKIIAARIPDGVISIIVQNGGPSVYIEIKNGVLKVGKNYPEAPRAVMSFSDIETAHGILNSKIDLFTAIATSKLQLKGYIPMIENMNRLLAQVSAYLIN